MPLVGQPPTFIQSRKKLRVSSKALYLVSPVFKAMLSGKFKEGAEYTEKFTFFRTLLPTAS